MRQSNCLSRIIKNYETQDLGEFDYHTLGPNWRTILNFWTYVDTLDNYHRKLISNKCRMNDEIYNKNSKTAYLFANQLVRSRVLDSIWTSFVSSYQLKEEDFNILLSRATFELIGMSKLLDSGHKLAFVPLFELSSPPVISKTLEEILDDLQPGCTLTIPGMIDVSVPIRFHPGITIRSNFPNNTVTISRL